MNRALGLGERRSHLHRMGRRIQVELDRRQNSHCSEDSVQAGACRSLLAGDLRLPQLLCIWRSHSNYRLAEGRNVGDFSPFVKRRLSMRYLLGSLSLLIASVLYINAQTVDTAILGTVLDPAGAPVSGATVTI